MSDSTANILTKLGGYHIEKRGQREVKVHNRKKKYLVTNSQNTGFDWAFTVLRSYILCLHGD